MVLIFLLLLLAPTPGQSQTSHCDKTQIYNDDFGYGYNINCQFLSNRNLDLIIDIKIINEISLSIDRCTLLDLPLNIFSSLKNIRIISISNSTFTISNPDTSIFQNLTKLNKLEVLNTRFYLSKDTFKGLNNLKQLILVNNSLSLSKFDDEVFSPLRNLKVLKMRDNSIKDIASVPICSLPQLVEIYLENNGLSSMKSSAFICQSKSKSDSIKIHVDNAKFPLPNHNFINVNDLTSNLVKLNLNGNKISDLGYSFDGLVNLKQLYLKRNRITDLSGFVFHSLYKIEIIDLSYNLLNTVTESVFAGKVNLKEINLSNNRIGKIALNVPNLKVLNLENNNCLLDSFFGLKNLESLNLAGNNISDIRQLKSDSLKLLNLNNNVNLVLYNESFLKIKNLEKLYLKNCQISSLPKQIFQPLKNLETLELSRNNLKSFDINAFNNLQYLEYLNLSYNQIEKIEYEFLKSLKNLETLDLSNNRLLTIEYELIFTQLPSLWNIYIKDNLFSCDILFKIVQFLKNKHINFTIHDPIYDHENINGISCLEKQDQRIESRKNATVIKSSMQVSDGSEDGMSAFSVIFILGLIFISAATVLYGLNQFYRRRRLRRLDEFELIG